MVTIQTARAPDLMPRILIQASSPKTSRTTRKCIAPWAKIGASAPIVSATSADNAGSSEDRGEKIKHARDETDVAPESAFDVGIQASGQRDAAPGEREGGDENRHRGRTDEEGERCARAELRRDQRGQGKNPGPHR